jgi:hypothetical protein
MKQIILVSAIVIILSACNSQSQTPESSSEVKEQENNEQMNNEQVNLMERFENQHASGQLLYQLIADIDGDREIDYFAVTGDAEGNNPIFWHIDNDGTGEVIVEASDTKYLSTEVVDRGNEKHIAFMTHYPPSNTKLWTIKLDNQEPILILEFMADWTIRIIPQGFQMVWKEYKDSETGGYDLVAENYIWDEEQREYSKKPRD